MKKIIISTLTILLGISLIATGYFYVHYRNFQNYVMHIIRNEVTQKNPALGYTFICTYDGTMLSYPVMHDIADKTIMGLFSAAEHQRLMKILQEIKSNKELLIRNIYDEHGHVVQLYLTSKDDNKIYGLIFFHDELKGVGADYERDALILLSLSFLMFLCSLFLLLGAVFIRSHRSWWYIVLLISCAMIAQLVCLWYLRKAIGFQEEFKEIPMLNRIQESSFIKKIESNTQVKYLTIPTGVLIECAQFARKEGEVYPGVFLKGYVWQRYNTKEHVNLERGFTISNANNNTVQELYHHVHKDEEIICWGFSCLLFQLYDPSLYPFDHRHITLSLLHKNFEKNVALVPDLSAYDFINPLELPGIVLQTVSLPYWNITKSFFYCGCYDVRTSLGSPEFAHACAPYLQFLITAERNVGGDCITYFVLLCMIFIIVFILLLAFLKQDTLKAPVGFSTLGVLGVCSGLLFVLITSEIDLRQTLVSEGIVYLEYLYLICYVAILGVIINGILFAIKEDLAFINYENNLICKLLYWPLVLFSIVLITAYTFY